MRRLIGAAILAAALTGGAAAAQSAHEGIATKADVRELAAARPAGPAQSCVQRNQIRETRVRSDSVIDFYMYGGRVYRNTLPNSCARLGFEKAFAYETSINQLCSVDIITVIDRSGSPGLRGPSCGLGEFQPITGVKR